MKAYSKPEAELLYLSSYAFHFLKDLVSFHSVVQDLSFVISLKKKRNIYLDF